MQGNKNRGLLSQPRFKSLSKQPKVTIHTLALYQANGQRINTKKNIFSHLKLTKETANQIKEAYFWHHIISQRLLWLFQKRQKI